MNTLKFLVFLAAALVVAPMNAFSKNELNLLGWDFTYRSVFNAAQIPGNDTVAKFFEDSALTDSGSIPRMFPAKFLDELQPPTIQAAIMFDHQAFYYLGHRVSSLYIKTSEEIVVHSYASKGGYSRETTQADADFARLLDGLWEWEQSQPNLQRNFMAPEGYVYSGYIGAMSLYREGKSRQVLLTPDDIMEIGGEDDSTNDMEAGRLYRYMDYLAKVGGNYAEFLAADASRPSASQRKHQEEEKQRGKLRKEDETCETALRAVEGDTLIFFTASWAQPAQEMRPIVANAAAKRNLRMVEKNIIIMPI